MRGSRRQSSHWGTKIKQFLDNDNASVCEQLVIFEAAFDFALHCQIRLGEFCFTCTMCLFCKFYASTLRVFGGGTSWFRIREKALQKNGISHLQGLRQTRLVVGKVQMRTDKSVTRVQLVNRCRYGRVTRTLVSRRHERWSRAVGLDRVRPLDRHAGKDIREQNVIAVKC